MIRKPTVVKTKKNSQSSSSKVNKANGTKFESNEQVKRKVTKAIGNGKSDDKPQTKVQGQAHVHSAMRSSNPNQMTDLAERKLERSNSFFLTRKLSKIYDSLTNSKESLKDNNNSLNSDRDKKLPFKFLRSVSLAAISLKKEYRNSMRKPQLEQLSEEDHQFDDAIANSMRKYDKNATTASVDSLSSRTSDKSSILSSFKRTFSLTPSRRKLTNPKWSASLMSLQQIDVMISYEDLSFIDYDFSNTYERNLMTKIKSTNQIDAKRLNAPQFPGVQMRSHADGSRRRHSTVIQQSSHIDEDTVNWLNANTKRWSNPCLGPNIECASFPSYDGASMAEIPPALDIDECDCRASTDCLIESRANPTNAAYSVDNLTGNTNDSSTMLLQTVSGV